MLAKEGVEPFRIDPLKRRPAISLDVTHVTVQDHFILLLEFENGESRTFDMGICIDQKSWVRLKSGHGFHAAFVENGTVAWPGNVDIDPETLYELSVPLNDPIGNDGGRTAMGSGITIDLP